MNKDYALGKLVLKWFIGVLILTAAISAGYVLFSKPRAAKVDVVNALPSANAPSADDFIVLRIYYPIDNGLSMEERRVMAGASPDEAVVREFLKGPSGVKATFVPEGAALISAMRGTDGIAYVNLTEEARTNFQGDAMAEYLFLRGLYESMTSGASNAIDVKVLVGGRETDSLGGHFSLLLPLGQSLADSAPVSNAIGAKQ